MPLFPVVTALHFPQSWSGALEGKYLFVAGENVRGCMFLQNEFSVIEWAKTSGNGLLLPNPE